MKASAGNWVHVPSWMCVCAHVCIPAYMKLYANVPGVPMPWSAHLQCAHMHAYVYVSCFYRLKIFCVCVFLGGDACHLSTQLHENLCVHIGKCIYRALCACACKGLCSMSASMWLKSCLQCVYLYKRPCV